MDASELSLTELSTKDKHSLYFLIKDLIEYSNKEILNDMKKKNFMTSTEAEWKPKCKKRLRGSLSQ